MARFFNQTLGVVFAIVLSVVVSSGMTAQAVQDEVPPIAKEFPLQEAGSRLSMILQITDPQIYAINLRFLYDKSDTNEGRRVRKLAGGAFRDESGEWQEPGAPLRLRIRVARLTGSEEKPVSDQEISGPRLTSWGAGFLDARLMRVSLEPGRYAISIENMKEADELRTVTTQIGVVRAYVGK